MTPSDKNTFKLNFSLKDLKILIVDDVKEAASFLANYLRRKGALVFVGHHGKEGLALFNKHQPQMIITDIQMPLMNGIEMVQAIREQDENIPVIFLTAFSEKEKLQESIALSATEYLIKPVSHKKLQSALSKAFTQIQKSQTVKYLQQEKQFISETVSKIIGDDEHLGINLLHRSVDIVSGDFYCATQYQNDLYVMLADGMGHGLSAVLPALELPKNFRAMASKGFGLPRIADELNQLLFEKKLVGHFVAAILVRFNTAQGLIEIINCGNPEGYLVDQEGRIVHRFSSNHFAFGIVGGDNFFPLIQTCQYSAPVKLYIFSDGLVETLDKVTENGGSQTVQQSLTDQSQNFLSYLDNYLDQIPGELFTDDITVLEISTPDSVFVQEQAAVKEQSIHQPEPVAIDKVIIVWVENETGNKKPFEDFLARKVASVHYAKTSEEGIRLFLRYQPNLIITALNNDDPQMTGLEMLARIREFDSQIPLIIFRKGHEAHLNWEEDMIATLVNLNICRFLPELNEQVILESIAYCCRRSEQINQLQLSASLFLSSPLAITLTDANKNIIAVNPAFTEITGYDFDEAIGSNPRILSSGKHNSEFYRNMWNSINNTGQWSGEIWNRRKNGEYFLEWITIKAICDSNQQVTHYASIFSDITQRTYSEEKIRHLAHHDALTDLPNRTLFYDRVSQAMIEAKSKNDILAIIYIDIDHFKTINDTLGHGVGDELIGQMALTLATVIRETDTIARLGGDEFGILLTNLAHEKCAVELTEKIFQSISKTYDLNNHELRVGVSMGISCYPRDGDSVELLLKRADTALNKAKEEGRNRYRNFVYTLEQLLERNMLIQQSMYPALENREFFIQYQPKYHLNKKQIVGAEALIRWKSAELGPLSPAEFIPIAEQTGFIIDIGHWLIEQVCQDITDWMQQGIELVPIAINISPIQFNRGNLGQTLLAILNQYQLPPSSIQIELTEGVIMNNQANTLAQLQAIKNKGIAISIDDFGTGYSSLSYLRQLPIDELKIDKSFIDEITDESSLLDSRLTAIPSAIIELAHKLQLRLVAEGVETELQCHFLKNQGCPVIQGYWFSRPLNAEDFVQKMKSS